LPRVLVEHYFLSIQLYRWIGAPLLLLLIYLGTGILTWLLGLGLRPLVDRLVGYREGRKIEFANVGPVRMLLVALTIQTLTDLPATALARHSWETVATVLMVVSIAWILIRLLRVGIIAAAVRMEHRKTPEKIAMAYLTGRLLQILVGLSAALIVLHIAGVELTGVFAGLGLGGIALALAAQKTLENFLGGVMVIGDAPVRVGDFCKVGEHQGTIEDIGLRSTRIRTMDRTLVHIPNALLSAVSLENFAGRDKIRFLHTLGLQRETTADQLRRIIEESQQMLSAHSRVETESARIRFIKVGVSSLDIEVLVYVLETDFTAFLAVQEDLLLRIMDIVESCGARLALPSQRMYDSGNWDHPSDAKFQPEPTGREVARG
jgi:MscS family membrane protein